MHTKNVHAELTQLSCADVDSAHWKCAEMLFCTRKVCRY